MTTLQQSILKTVCYFDLFDYPLTLLEIQKWLPVSENLPAIKAALKNTEAVKSSQGFYFLKGRQNLVELRKRRYAIAQLKFKKRLPYIRLLSYLPYVSAIFIANNLAISNARPKSDLDVVIVARKNIWTTRFFTTGLTALLGLRPSPQNSKDKICLSVYLTQDHLDLEKYKIGPQDIHFTYWADQMVPLYDRDGIYKKYRSANQWLKKTLPHSLSFETAEPRKIKNNFLKNICQSVLSIFTFEKFYKKIQLKKLPERLKSLMNQDTRVVINDQILKFHDNDPRTEIQKNWEQKASTYN